MSINWVMLSPTAPNAFTPLASESILFTSPPRTTLSLSSLNKFPGHTPFTLSSSSGTLYLTNRRLVYLPAAPTPQLQSFAAPILNLHDSHVTAPWIGPNVWTALVQPVKGGGIPATHAALECKISFKEGGAYDFQSRYERVRERLQQAVEVARESGNMGGASGEEGVDVGNVHLDQLPAYGAPGVSVPVEQGVAENMPVAAAQPTREQQPARRDLAETTSAATAQVFTPPNEPPPGYEEVQRETVQHEFDRRLSDPRSGL